MKIYQQWFTVKKVYPSFIIQCKQDIDEELAFHLQMLQEEYKAKGYSAEKAKELAEQHFGNKQKYKKACLNAKLGLFSPEKLFIIFALCCVFLFSVFEIQSQNKWKKVSPFAAVEITENNTKVNIDEKWYELKSINHHSVEDILAHSKIKYDQFWEKRFVEDIYEVLEELDVLSGMNVELELVNDVGMVINRHVQMTKSNRVLSWLHAKEKQAVSDEDLEYVRTMRNMVQNVQNELHVGEASE